MSADLPPEILSQKKQGFAVPLGHWFRGKLSPFVREVLLSETTRRRGILDPGYIESLLRRHGAGKPLDLSLWTLVSLELWCRTFLDPGARLGRPRAGHRVERARVLAAG